MFSVQDFHDLIRILEEHPEWRSELRRLVLTDELLQLPRAVKELADEVRQLTRAQLTTEGRFQVLAEALRQTQARIEELAQAQRRTEERLEQLAQAQRRTEERLEQLAQAQRRTEERVAQLAEAQRRTDERLEALAARVEQLAGAQQRTEERLEALAGDVQRLVQAQAEAERRMGAFADSVGERLRSIEERLQSVERDLGELKGVQLQRAYVEQAAGYFGAILENLRVVSRDQLGKMLDQAVRDGRLSFQERQEVMWSDLVVRGRLRTTGAEAYLLVEVSWGIGVNDVGRAAARACALGKLVPAVVAAVAGKSITHEAAEMARRLNVVRVTNGRVEGFGEDVYIGSP